MTHLALLFFFALLTATGTVTADSAKATKLPPSVMTTEAVPEAALLMRFDEAKWRVTVRHEEKGAVLRRVSLLNESEQKSLSIVTPRVGKRAASLSELADGFAMQVDETPAPKRSKIDFLGREAILICGVATNQDRTVQRGRAIVVFFSGGEEWGIIYSCRPEITPGIEDILRIVGPLK